MITTTRSRARGWSASVRRQTSSVRKALDALHAEERDATTTTTKGIATMTPHEQQPIPSYSETFGTLASPGQLIAVRIRSTEATRQLRMRCDVAGVVVDVVLTRADAEDLATILRDGARSLRAGGGR